nr:DUF3265 domain-containing protein [Vibrio anguillarum]
MNLVFKVVCSGIGIACFTP